MDNEMHDLLRLLPVKDGSIPTVLEYYESTDVVSLTNKLRSIEAFKGIKAPMIEVEGGFIPDFNSRYFTEDFPYGLSIVRELTHKYNVPSPTIDRIYDWGIKMINKHNEARE